jgi:hypothetical protein
VAQAAIIWDYSPASQTPAGDWSDISTDQNFAASVTFQTGAKITGYDHYTDLSYAGGSEYRLKPLADNGGTPGALLLALDLSPNRFDLAGTYNDVDVYRASFSFPELTLAPGVKYWIGVSGVSEEVGQTAVWTYPSSQQYPN